jgi:hypothetical protein
MYVCMYVYNKDGFVDDALFDDSILVDDAIFDDALFDEGILVITLVVLSSPSSDRRHRRRVTLLHDRPRSLARSTIDLPRRHDPRSISLVGTIHEQAPKEKIEKWRKRNGEKERENYISTMLINKQTTITTYFNLILLAKSGCVAQETKYKIKNVVVSTCQLLLCVSCNSCARRSCAGVTTP